MVVERHPVAIACPPPTINTGCLCWKDRRRSGQRRAAKLSTSSIGVNVFRRRRSRISRQEQAKVFARAERDRG